MNNISIFIPTYNRSSCLLDCVKSVVASMKGFEDRVELIVSDDGSTDSTENDIQEIQQKYPIVKYKKNIKNLYTDIHFSDLIASSTHDYYWLIGDDDKIAKGAIKEILHQLDSGKNLIYCNYSIWSKDFSELITYNGLGISKNICFTDHNKLLEKVAFNMGYISSVIGKKSHFIDIPKERRDEFSGFTMPQVFPLYAGQVEKCNAIILAESLVLNRSGNNSERNWHHIFVTGSNKIFNELITFGYSSKSIKRAKFKVLIDYIIPHTFALKINTNIKEFHFKLLFQHYKIFLLFYVTCVPIILMPKKIVGIFQNTLSKVPVLLKKIYGTL